jgi:protein-S-isoprenylcysteine O-methyltransferase Ste14
MKDLILFLILSIPITFLSRRTLFNIKSHGFYRFYAWELILLLVISNYRHWFEHLLSTKQIVSWIFLICASYTLIAGAILMKKAGKPQQYREDATLFDFEKTTELIETGIFRYIRHPLYSSLLFLTWAIFLKNTTIGLFLISLLSSVFLCLTALFDENECIAFFGEKYKDYMKRTKMFVPFLI